MEQFTCTLIVKEAPTQLRPGETAVIEVAVESPNATLGFVVLSIPEAGEALRFAKKDESLYRLTYTVPEYTPAGVYDAYLYATGDNGTRTPSQRVSVRIASA